MRSTSTNGSSTRTRGCEVKRILACQECKRQWDVTPYGVGQKLRCVCGFLMDVPRVTPRAPEVAHCHSCGAPRAPGKDACQYCGAVPTNLRMSLVCPFCMCRTADESKFCQSCGKVIEASSFDATSGTLLCPRCAKPRLLNRTIGSFTTDECPRCGGMWMAASVFDRIVNQQSREREEKEYAGEVKTWSPVESDCAGVVYLRCPACRKHMNRRNFARASGVIVDDCREHGTWLDRDELEKIAAYVATGGMRRTKEIELRELEDRKKAVLTPVGGVGGAALLSPGMESEGWKAADIVAGAAEGLPAVLQFLSWLTRR